MNTFSTCRKALLWKNNSMDHLGYISKFSLPQFTLQCYPNEKQFFTQCFNKSIESFFSEANYLLKCSFIIVIQYM